MEKNTLRRYIEDRMDYMVRKYNSWLFRTEDLFNRKKNEYYDGAIEEFKGYQKECRDVLYILFDIIYETYGELSAVLLTLAVIPIVFIFVFESDLYPFVEMDKIIEIINDDFATDIPDEYFKKSIELMFEILAFIDWTISWKPDWKRESIQEQSIQQKIKAV